MPIVYANGLRLYYLDRCEKAAEGSLPVLLIHGHASHLEEYLEFLPLLAKGHRILVPDLPGCGRSDKPNRRYTLALYEESLLGFLDALDVRRAHVVGGSLGGNLALRLAHREPERFARVAAWAPGGVWDPLPRWLAWVVRTVHRPMLQDLLFWPMLRFQSRFWYEEGWSGKAKALKDAFAYYREVHSPSFVRMYWEIAYAQLTTSLFPLAPRITQPTWLGWGDRDHGLNMGKGVRRLASLIPRCELKVFPGARHSLANEVPHDLAAAIISFLGS